MFSRLRTDARICLVFIVLSSAFLVESYSYDVRIARYPRALLILLLVLCLTVLFQSIRKSAEKRADTASSAKHYAPVVITSLLISAYFLGLWYLGIIAPTACFMAFMMWYFGERRWTVIVITTIIFCAVLYVVFILFLGVPIPLFPGHA